MPDFELRFVAVPEIKQDADKDLRKQWERRFQNQVVGKLAVDAEIPKQTLTKLRNQYAQIMNDLGKTTLDVGKDIAGLRQQYGKAFDMTGITDQFKSDLAKTGNTIESLTQAAEKHAAQVRQLESEYVNLKAKMREAAQTLEGEAKTSAIDELEAKVRDLGEQIKRTFGADELEHFNRTMGELGGKGSAQVVGVQEYADSISGLRTRIVELAGEGERLVRVTQEWDGKQWIDTSTQIQDRTQKLRDEFKKFEKQVRDLENRYQLSKAGSSYAQEWKNMTHEMESFNAEMPDARQNLERWQEVLSRTKGELGNAGNNLSKYKEQLKDVRDAEVALKLAQLESHGLRTTAVIQAEAVVEEKRHEAEETKRLLVNTDKLNDANVAYTKSEEALKQSLDKTEKAWKKKNSLLSNISAGFADATARIINYTSVYRAMWFAISKFKQSIQTAEELNKAFTSIQLVTLGTAEATEKLRKEYADLAHEMSATVTDVAEGADAWLRQGKSAEEATQLIRASMVMSRIGVIKSAEATEYLTSVLNGYNMEAQDVMHVVDAMSQVDIESASSIDDLAIALQRSTATAQQAGVSFERLLGYVAAVRETTQRSASVIGEAMKSIFSRMGSVKAGTFLSEDLESEYSDITTYVNDVEKVLSKVGIRLRDTNKDFRDAQDILDEVAKGWETYDDLTKQALATAIAGTRQRENFLALMQSYDKALALENSALNSNGKAMQKYAVYQDSIAAKQDRINALAQTWVQNMNFEWVIGELLSLGEAFMKVFSNKLVVQAGMATAAILAFVKAARSLVLMGKLFMEMRGVVSTGTLLTQILGAAGLGTVLPVVVALTIAITGLVYIIDKLHHSSAELAQELQGLDNEIDSSQSEIDEYKSKIAENDKKIQELQDTINKGIGGLVEQDELDRLKEENKQLERQISLEQKRLDLVKEQRKQTAEELYGKKFRVGRYSVGYGRNTATKDVHQYGSVEVAPEDVIATYQKQIDDLRKEYEKAADNNNEKLAKTIEAKINELESELTNTVVPQLELLREYYPEIAEVLDAYYDSLMSYADRVENIKVEYPDEYAEFGKIVAENSEAFQAYLDGDDEALNKFADILSGKASPAIYAMIMAMQQAGIPLTELIRLLLNAANAGEDFSNSIKLETPASQIKQFKDKVKSVVAAEEELAETGYVSADAAAELAEAYGEEVYDAMVWTSKGYKISRSELEALIEKQKENYILALNDAKRAAAAVIEANGGRTISWNAETTAILANIKAVKAAKMQQLAYMRGADAATKEAAMAAYDEIKDAEDSLANAQENYDNLLKTLAYLRTSTTKTSGKSDAETAYEREIRLLEHEVYLSQQMADFYDGENDEANYRAEVNKQMAIYIKLMDAAHAEAERLRALGYAETSEEIQNLQQAWWGYYNKRRDLATGLADWEKQTTEDALNDVKDAINDLLDEAEDKLKDKLDALQAKIDKNEAIKKLHEVFFGILNDVADGIHEIDKELEASLSSADYLDEQLRQAIFNEDDYNKMSAKLNQIADESRVLFKDYLNQLEMLTEDEIYKADYITDEFERQYQYKELEYAIAEKELALAKAQTKLQNTLMNRNVRMYKNGQWIWTADYSAVQEAKKEVRDAEYEYRDVEIKLKQQEVLDKYAGIISALNLQKDAAQNEFDRLKDYWERVQKQLTTEESAMQRLLNAINNTDIPQFRQIINSVGKGLIDLINGIGTGTGMGSLIGTDEKYYGESASGELYPIGTDKGKDFIENAPAGSNMTGGDGSQWTKLADGSTMITKKGKVYYVPAPSYGGYGGGGSNISFGTGSIYNPTGGTAAGGWSFGAGGTMVSGSGYVAGSSGGKNVVGAVGGAGTSGNRVPAYSGGQPHYSGGYGDDYVAPRTDGWTPGQTLPGTSKTTTAGTAYENWVLADGSPPNLMYKDTGIYAKGTKGSYGIDMSRDNKWAGQTVEKNGYVISYDENGYARSAINVRAGSRNENLANKYPRVDADGNIMYSKSGMWSSNTGRGYYYSTSDTFDDTIYWDETNPNYVGGTPSSDLSQRRYLENLVKTGNYGQKEWAKAELAKMGTSVGSSSGSGSSSSRDTSSRDSSSGSSDNGKSNQQRYLESLVKSGNYGQKEWAKDQLNKGLYDSGGVLDGIGGIKATTKDETVFGPELSSKLLSPQKSKEFLNSATALTKILDNSSALSSMLNRFADLVSGNNSVPNDSHDVYFNGNPLGGMTRADSVALTSILRRYIPISGGGR